MLEDLLAHHGLLPDIEDQHLAHAYEHCPATHKSILKNAISFAYALAQNGPRPLTSTKVWGHVQETMVHERLPWAFFGVDLSCFPITAVASAMTLALVAQVDTLVVHVQGLITQEFLVACDLLAVDQIFTRAPQELLTILATAGKGIVIDLAGLNLDYHPLICPDPKHYGVQVELPPGPLVQAYTQMTAQVHVEASPYISYGGQPGSAPMVMSEQFLGCWIWDILSPAIFCRTTRSYS